MLTTAKERAPREEPNIAATILRAAVAGPVPVQTIDPIIWQQSINYSTFRDYGPSVRTLTQVNRNSELADDFDITGTISAVRIINGSSGSRCSANYFNGVYVRFYAFGADNKPGALQAEYFLPRGSSNLTCFGDDLGQFRATLDVPFQASGKHFLTVQIVLQPATMFEPSTWYWRGASADPVRGQAPYFRDSLAGGVWGRTGIDGTQDLAFWLHGTRTLSTPVITSLSRSTIPQAGRLIITGNGFGAQQGTGVVRIGGAIAPVSSWSDFSITAYVSDQAQLGATNVQVVTSGGASNAQPVTVTTRAPVGGRVRWRFQADSDWILSRPAVGTDGTIYALGRNGRLYALEPDGGVKWIYRAADGYDAVQAVGVGADGTVYFADGNDIYAINPDGTERWRLTDPSGSRVVAGPNIGPDGNIYAVTGDAGSSGGFGAVTISPAGTILRRRTGYIVPGGSAGMVQQIAFGPPGQFYFGGLNNLDGNNGLQFFQLGGTFRFARPRGGKAQPAVAPNGTIYVGGGGTPGAYADLVAFDPNGNLLRVFFDDGQTQSLSAPDVGPDGTVYMWRNLDNVIAMNPDGSLRWTFASRGILGRPIVDPTNRVVVFGGYEIDLPGFVQGVNTAGQAVWQVTLPFENGAFVRPFSIPRFTPDGATVYVGMVINDYAADKYTYLYAFDAAPTPNNPPSVTLTSPTEGATYTTQVTLSANATDTDGTINRVEFYANSDLIATDMTAPYSYSWPYPPGGNYAITARATDDSGAVTTSAPVNITVIYTGPAPLPRITDPPDGTAYPAPTPIDIAADVAGPPENLDRMEFYANSTLIGVDREAPYIMRWGDMAAGRAYSLTARSVTPGGTTATSTPVTITVGGQTPTEPIRVVLSRDASNNLRATITITNPTASAIPGVQMMLARVSTLDGASFVDGVAMPQSLGTINPGQSVVATVTFPGTASVPAGFNGLVRVNLSYTGGTYSETKQVTTP